MLAGVLAHEIGHIEQRHSVRVMARTSLTAALSAALLGDFSAVAAGAPAILLKMQYSREMETAADRYAAAALQQRGLPLAPLAAFFERIEEQQAKVSQYVPDWLRNTMAYAASHPSNRERAALLNGGR